MGGGSRLVTFAYGRVGLREAAQGEPVIPGLAAVGPLRAARLKDRERSGGVTEPQATFSACFGARFIMCRCTRGAI